MPSLNITQVLEALRKTGSIEEAARLLHAPKSLVRLYAYTLASQGLISLNQKTGSCTCSTCPLRRLCGR